MRRLRDENGDPLLDEAAKLVCSAIPDEPSSLVEARIWARMNLARRAHKPPLLVRAALPAVVIVLLMAVAGATAARVWRNYFAPTPSVSTRSHASETVTSPVPVPVPVDEAPVQKEVQAPAPTLPATRHERKRIVAPAPSEDPLPSLEGFPVAAPDPAPAYVPAATTPTPQIVAEEDQVALPSEASLVLGAVRALRQDRDPKRALKLLDQYRRQFPSGDLGEEALALLIEARSLQNDRRAGPLAEDYLRRFPGGRFRIEAEHARQRFLP